VARPGAEDRAVFDAVIGGCGGSDFMAELAPMREVRPSKGGVGWSEEAVAWLRGAAGVNLAALAGEGK
jgi:hypothetical protein